MCHLHPILSPVHLERVDSEAPTAPTLRHHRPSRLPYLRRLTVWVRAKFYRVCMAGATSVAVVPAPPPAAATKVGMFTYAREFAAGAATLFQEVPIAGEVFATFLAFEQLVDTARSNKEELVVLRELCDVVIKGVLEQCAERASVLEESFQKLKKYVNGAKEAAEQCKGGMKQLILSRKISKDIAAVRKNVLDFSVAINIVIGQDLSVSWSVFVVEDVDLSFRVSQKMAARSAGVQREDVVKLRFITTCADVGNTLPSRNAHCLRELFRQPYINFS